MKTRLRKKHVEQMETYCSERCKPAVQYVKKALEYYMNGSRVQNYTPDNCPLHDPLAMVAAVVPSIVKIQKKKGKSRVLRYLLPRNDCNGFTGKAD